MMSIKFTILREETFDARRIGGQPLTKLGGCHDYNGEFGLGDWQCEFDVKVTNQHGESKHFTVAYQPEERSNRLKAYSGYDITTAGCYGCDADESNELLEFCDYDASVLYALHDKAKKAAKAEYERLLAER